MRRWYVWLPVSAVLIGLLVWRTRPWEAGALGALDVRWIVAGIALNVVVIVAWAVRSAGLMRAVGYPLGLGALIPVVSFANTINNLTPASSGEVLRALILRRRYGVPYAASVAVILVERFWAIGIMALSAGAAAAWLLLDLSAGLSLAAWAVAIGGSFLPTILTRAGLRPASRLATLLRGRSASGGRLGKLADSMEELDSRLEAIAGDLPVATRFVASTAVVFACYTAQLLAITTALGATIEPFAAWAALGLATLAGAASALPFGLGSADLVLTGLLGVAGIDAATAAATALLLRVVATLPLGIAGTISWLALNRDVPAAADTA